MASAMPLLVRSDDPAATVLDMELLPAESEAPALWAKEQLDRNESSTGMPANSVVPDCFPRFARVFHRRWCPTVEAQQRFQRLQDDLESDDPRVRAKAAAEIQSFFGREPTEHTVTWTEVAERNGRIAHPLMQWQAINPPFSAKLNYEGGSLMDTEEQRLLVRALTPTTGTPDRCVFGFWEGRGADLEGGPTVELFHVFHLYRGPLEALFNASDQLGDEPSMFWPEDRAWFVRNDIDSDSTVVGGSGEAIDALLAEQGLEVMEINGNDDLGSRGDNLNELDPTNPYAEAMKDLMGPAWDRLPEHRASLLTDSADEYLLESLKKAIAGGESRWLAFDTPGERIWIDLDGRG